MALAQHDEGRDHLAAQRIRPPGDAGLGHRWMLEEGGFDLDRAHPVRGDFDHLIGAPGKPDEAILIDVGRVPGVVDAWNPLPVVAGIALGIAPERLNQPGKWALDDHDALFAGWRTGAPSGVTTAASMPGNGMPPSRA